MLVEWECECAGLCVCVCAWLVHAGGRSSQKDAAKQAEEAVDAVKEAASKAWKGANSKEAKQVRDA